MVSFIDKWYEKLRPYLFKYKDGFFELPYLGNTPLLMIESFRRMPFIKHNEKLKMIISKSPFVDANVKYQELEEDLIIIYSTLYIKSNVCFRSTIKKEIPNGYYCLTYSTNLEFNNSSKRIINGEPLENSSFQLLKPTVKIKTYHFKNAHFETFQLYFKENWLINYLKNTDLENEKLLEFVHSKNDSFISSLEENDFMPKFINDIKTHLELNFTDRDPKFLHENSLNFLNYFIENSFNKSTSSQYYFISNNDRLKLLEVEKMLLDNLTTKFPGIGSIANEVGFSETKLKYLFKQLHHKTLLDYYQEEKMKAAYKMLTENAMKVTEVANHFGYTNVSKFSAMFKAHIHSLPSKVNTQEVES